MLTLIPMPALAPVDNPEECSVLVAAGVIVKSVDVVAAVVATVNVAVVVVVVIGSIADIVDVDFKLDVVVVVDPASHIVTRSEGAAPTKVSFVGDWQFRSFSFPPQHFQEPSELS
jgi:hypothetical protein